MVDFDFQEVYKAYTFKIKVLSCFDFCRASGKLLLYVKVNAVNLTNGVNLRNIFLLCHFDILTSLIELLLALFDNIEKYKGK